MTTSYLIKNTSNKRKKIVGRGSSRGKTAGRGTKGQKARAGHRIRPHIRDIIKKLPKLRGRGKNSNKAFRLQPVTINLAALDRAYKAGARVTPSSLFAAGLITRMNGVIPPVKILAQGELSKALMIYDCTVSAGAQQKITAVGGTVH